MRRNAKLIAMIIFCLFGVGVFGAYESLARIGATSECGGCHTNTGVLTLTSNASGTVEAIVGQKFWLLVDAGGYTGGDNLFAISMQPDWADNAEFGVVPTEIQDGGLGDLDPTTDAIQALFDFTPQSEGNYTIRIWTASDGLYGTVLDVEVEVIFIDSEPPTINSPEDIEISMGDPGASITWTPEDATPDRYEVLDQGLLFENDTWDGSPITVQLDTLTLGVHNLTITVWDVDNRSISDTVFVTVVDDAPPSIDGPGDLDITLGTTGNTIVWDPKDPSPASYEIFKDQVSIKTGIWNSSLETITQNIDGLAWGQYNYTLLVTDEDEMTATDTVIVTVGDFTTPTVTSPADIEYTVGSTGYSFTWTLYDDHPVSYTVYFDGMVNRTGAWNSTGETITVDADDHSVEYYNYTILLTDLGENQAVDSVFVRVNDPTLPTLDHPPDQYIAEFSTGYTIYWHPYDAQMGDRSFNVYRDDEIVRSGKWPGSNTNIWANLDGLGLGSYNYTCEIWDNNNNYAYDTVWVYVLDDTDPILSSEEDVLYPEGDTGTYTISWTGTDAHPMSYEIFLDDVLVKSGDWNSSAEQIEYDAGGLPYGVHTLTLDLVDVGSNEVSDSVTITVFDGTEPTISDQVDVLLVEGGSGTILSWNGTDLHPALYTIYFQDGILQTGNWNTTDDIIEIGVTGFEFGIYNYTVILTDEGANTAVDQAIITVIDSTLPQIDSPADVSYSQGETGNYVNWTGTDLHPSTYEVFIDEILSLTGAWSTSPETFSIPVDGLTTGVHQVTMIIYDLSGNSVSDSVTVTVIDRTAPFINAPEDIEYTAGRVGNYFIWSVTDSNPKEYTIYLEGAILTSGTLNDTSESVIVFVDGLSVGIHNYTLVASDLIGNSAVDTVIVTVNAGTDTSTTGTTSTSTGSTNTTGGTDAPPDGPAPASLSSLVIALTYVGCIAGALIVAEFYRRRAT